MLKIFFSIRFHYHGSHIHKKEYSALLFFFTMSLLKFPRNKNIYLLAFFFSPTYSTDPDFSHLLYVINLLQHNFPIRLFPEHQVRCIWNGSDVKKAISRNVYPPGITLKRHYVDWDLPEKREWAPLQPRSGHLKASKCHRQINRKMRRYTNKTRFNLAD